MEEAAAAAAAVPAAFVQITFQELNVAQEPARAAQSAADRWSRRHELGGAEKFNFAGPLLLSGAVGAGSSASQTRRLLRFSLAPAEQPHD